MLEYIPNEHFSDVKTAESFADEMIMHYRSYKSGMMECSERKQNLIRNKKSVYSDYEKYFVYYEQQYIDFCEIFPWMRHKDYQLISIKVIPVELPTMFAN